MYDGTLWACKKFGNYNYVVSNWRHLIDAIAGSCGNWKVIFSNTLDLKEIEGNVLFVIKPQERMHSVPRPLDDVLIPLSSLPPHIKLVTLHDDIHMSKGKYFRAVLDRTDIILTTYWTPFLKRWPEYESKLFHFPFFLLPEGRYENLPFNEDPILKCLVPGIMSEEYPLRSYIFHQWRNDHNVRPIIESTIQPLRHPGYNVNIDPEIRKISFIGDEWAKELNKYYCTLADCLVHGYTVAKYMEIPAAGSLLLANTTEDMKLLGFEDGQNYINVNQENVIETIQAVLSNPPAYEAVRVSGRAHALGNFGKEATIRRIREVIGKL